MALAAPSLAPAATPPGPVDPCSHDGRDACGTAGVGFYRVYRYGLRWFGDFRGAVPGVSHAFCLDFRYWYASRSYRYRRHAAAGLRNRDGAPVPAERRRRLAYAIWSFGRTGNPVRQAAVMLYVHSLMGDARPGEAAPDAAGAGVARVVRRIGRAAALLHGPYRVEARLPKLLTVGRPATATLRVVSAHGRALPHLRLALAATGATGVPAHASTNANGVARVSLTPTAADGLRLRVRTAPLASTEPQVWVPTAGAARANGQRLAAPASQRVSAAIARTDVRVTPKLTSEVSLRRTTPGASVTSTVTVRNLGGSSPPVQVELFGPFTSRKQISCSGTPLWSGAFAAGETTTTTAPVRLARAGWYAYRVSIVPHGRMTGAATPCGGATETTVVLARPSLTTVASAEVVRPGARIFDRVRVRGLGSTPARVEVELFGPFGSRRAIRCTPGRLVAKSRLTVPGDGTTRTPPVTLKRAGFYGYRERLLGTPLVTAAATPCAPRPETALAAPSIVTGRGDVAAHVPSPARDPRRPARIRIDSLGIDAPVDPSAIDVVHGVLGIPTDIDRTGWWSDGALPGDAHGVVLLAGHVDSATAGAGAFFALRRARTGDRIRLVTASGRTVAYRVASVRAYRKEALPTSVYSSRGSPRLVLVTCGGPFDEVTGHYRDDVVVTALPGS